MDRHGSKQGQTSRLGNDLCFKPWNGGDAGVSKRSGRLVLPGRAPRALGCAASRQGRRDSSGHWHWSRPHLPGPQTKAIRPHPPGCCPGSL